MAKDKVVPKSAGVKPPTEERLDEVFRELEPYLKSGLSLNKACTRAKTPTSTIYDWVEAYPYFSEKIKGAKMFFSMMMTSTVMQQMKTIIDKQKAGQPLDSDDLGFVKWTATNSKATQEEFGKRIEHAVYDPEIELKKLMRIIDESSPEEIL